MTAKEHQDRRAKVERSALDRRKILLGGTTIAASALAAATPARTTQAQQRPAAPAAPASGQRPNILFIMGDDIGWFNVSAYNMGIMGYRTPNIDRIGREGALFTDWYGQQSCTAGRAAFITGQSPIRTGLTKVGLPGAELGLGPHDPTRRRRAEDATAMRPGQFGKNHLGDRDEHLPTVHGFDEFFGNLYHLNAEEEPENPDYPKDPGVPQEVRAARRASQVRRRGRPEIENTGPLTKKRMETIDEEFLAGAKDFINRQHQRQQAVVLLLQLDPDARLHAPQDGIARQDRPRPLSRRHGRARRACRRAAEAARRPRRRRQHHRCLHDRQRRRSRLPGPTAARRRSGARRRPTGRADSACRA